MDCGHKSAFALQVDAAKFDRAAVAAHADNLATKIRGNLTNSMKGLGVDILIGVGTIMVQYVPVLTTTL